MSAESVAERMPSGYKQTEVGVIPEDWGVGSVGEAFEIHNHLRIPISQKVREQMVGKYPYYGPTGIQGYINEYRIEGNYTLIGEDGDHFLKWRSMPMTLMVSGKFNVNNHAHVIKGINNLTSWFYYYFSHKDLTQHLTRQGAGRYKLTKKALLNVQCVLPPLPEQEAIATALSDTDALIESLEQLIAKKRHIKQGAMQELLTGKKRLPGFSGEWIECSLRDCLLSNPDYGINAPGVQNSGSLPTYLRITDIDDDGRFSPSIPVAVNHSLAMNYVLGRNEIVFARTGASVGKTYLYNIKDGELVFAGFLIRARINCEKLCPEFFAAFTKTSRYWNWVRMMSMRSGQPGINGNEFASLDLHLPPTLEEQTAIATILSDMDAEITALEEKLGKARQIKQGMMQELLTGRIRLV